MVGATVQDELSGDSFTVHARTVINATGAFADTVRLSRMPCALIPVS